MTCSWSRDHFSGIFQAINGKSWRVIKIQTTILITIFNTWFVFLITMNIKYLLLAEFHGVTRCLIRNRAITSIDSICVWRWVLIKMFRWASAFERDSTSLNGRRLSNITSRSLVFTNTTALQFLQDSSVDTGPNWLRIFWEGWQLCIVVLLIILRRGRVFVIMFLSRTKRHRLTVSCNTRFVILGVIWVRGWVIWHR